MFPYSAKVAVVGGREFTDYPFMERTLDRYHLQYGVSWLISGGARGADTLGVKWAHQSQIQGYTIHLAQWDRFGKRAGYRRNLLIVEQSDVVIAFPGLISKGTWHTINLAKRLSVPAIICYSPAIFIDKETYDVRGEKL